jgi:GNAT superfamily N-acetyltransferase
VSGGTPRVWLAGADEAEHVACLLVEFRDHNGQTWPSDNAFLAGVERLMDDINTDFVLGAPHDDAPPGGIVQLRYRFGLWRAGTDCLVEDVFVSEAARGAGLGRALIDFSILRARERGARRMELDTNEANEAALALYAGVGFSATENAYGKRDLYLRLHLDEGGRGAGQQR